ncbi:MAG: pyrroline-5-carboxylate reductase [Alphaproteobacteria bacterium]
MNPSNNLSGDFKVLLVGCGEMGSAMLDGWLMSGLSKKRIFIVEHNPEKLARIKEKGLFCSSKAQDVPDEFIPDVVFFAVRPQNMEETVKLFTKYKSSKTVFLSIVAGKTINYFSSILGSDAEIVRAMPNSPAKVLRGITVAYANETASEDKRLLCSALLNAVGEIIWVRDENLMDAVTAVSGTGPAYLFHLVEALAIAGVNAGLPEYLSMKLARSTICGAGELLYQTAETATNLRKEVTTQGGTTAAAFDVLLDPKNGLAELMTRAVANAAKRSKELASK